MLALALVVALLPAEPARTIVVPVVVGASIDPKEIVGAVEDAGRHRVGLELSATPAPPSIAACGPDEACLAAKLAELEHARALILVVNFMAEKPLLALRLFDARVPKMIAAVAAPIERDERGLRNAITTRAAALFDELGFTPRARLIVHVTPADAELHVAGAEPDPTDARAFYLPVGSTRVRAERAGYSNAEAEVAATPGASLEVTLVLAPSEAASLFSSPWFWAATIGTAVLAGTLIYVAAESGGCTCIARPDKPCSC